MLSWRRRLLLLALLALVAVAGGLEHGRRATLAWNPRNLVRLHVVAHSDAPRDQEAKLAVRDAVVQHYAGRIPASPRAAARAIRAELPRVEELACEVLRRQDLDYEARVQWGVYAFPDRTYGERLVPAGDYRAVRVVLGTGQGDNWWCVLFPPLCFLDRVAGEPPAAEVARQLEAAPVEVRLWFWERAAELARRWPALSRWLESKTSGPGQLTDR